MRLNATQYSKISKQLYPKVCSWCSATFWTSHPDQARYCCDSHRQLSYQARKLQQISEINGSLDEHEEVKTNEIETTLTNENMTQEFEKILSLTTQLTESRSELRIKDLEIDKLKEKSITLSNEFSDFQKNSNEKIRQLSDRITDYSSKYQKAETELKDYRNLEQNYYKLEQELDIISEKIVESEASNTTLQKQLKSALMANVVFLYYLNGKVKIPYMDMKNILGNDLKKSMPDSIDVYGFIVDRKENEEFFNIKRK